MAEAPFEVATASMEPDEVRRRDELDYADLMERLTDAPPVIVAVPVFNGGDAVRRCLNALLQWTRAEQLLVIDDASTDRQTVRLLDRLEADHNVRLVRHADNWGYTRTANHAMELAGSADVVLLNSDTVVGPLWLQRLRWVAYSVPDAASVTAASDNAGAMSLPVAGRPNAWPTHLSWAEVARHAAVETTMWAQHVPTAHGFCAYLRRAAIEKIGGFDAAAFPRGYGEENDWSRRADAAGFVNLFAPHVFVRHARSQSFGAEREDLVAQGRAVIDDRWPDYTLEVRRWLASPGLARISEDAAKLERSAQSQDCVKPRRLYVLHRSGGGTPATNLDLMGELQEDQETLVLENIRGEACELFRVTAGGPTLLARWKPERRFMLQETWRPDYGAFVAQVLVDYGIELVHIRHLIHSPVETLPEVCRRLGIPFVYSTHDFHAVCPTVQLLDENLHYCGGVCTPGRSNCTLSSSPLNKLDESLKNGWVHTWRQSMSRVMNAAEAVVATTSSARSTLLGTFPQIEHKLRVIEHGRDVLAFRPSRPTGRRKPGPFRILAPAMWAPHKGIEYVRSMADLLGQEVEWHILGQGGDALLDVGIVHGEYSRGSIQELTEEIDPDVVGIFSIWAETYAHTLTEAWAMGIPCLVTDLGAPAERVRAHGGGQVIPVSDPVEAAHVVRSLAEDPNSVSEKLGPAPTSSIRSPLTMANEYRDLYDAATGGSPRRVGLVIEDELASPWSSAGRAYRRAQHHASRELRFERLSVPDYIAGHVSPPLDAVIVVGDSLPPGSLGAFLGRAQSDGTRVVVEADPGLLRTSRAGRSPRAAIPAPSQLNPFLRLCTHADEVIVGHQVSAEWFQQFGVSAKVIEPRLDDRLWVPPVDAAPEPKRKLDVRILYLDRGEGETWGLERLDGVPSALSKALGRPVVIEVVGPGGPVDHEGMRRLRPQGAGQAAVASWVRQHRLRWAAAVEPRTGITEGAGLPDDALLECAMLEVPVVSPAVDAQACDENALIAGSVSDDRGWATTLAELLSDTEVARAQAQEARRWTAENRMLSACPTTWIDCVMGLSVRGRAGAV